MRTRAVLILVTIMTSLMVFDLGSAKAQRWSGSEDVAVLAHRFSDSALQLFRTIRSVEGYSHLADDARHLAMTAEEFHRTLESGSDYPELIRDFRAMHREYQHVRAQFFRSHQTHHIGHLVDEWAQVASGYEVLALSMGVGEPDAYSNPPPRGYGRKGRWDDRPGPRY